MNKKTVCVGVETPKSDWPIEDSIAELNELAITAGLEPIEMVTQSRENPNKLSYIGKGKLEELLNQ